MSNIIKNRSNKVAFRKKLYQSIEEIQTDLDIFMSWYNNDRTNQGRYCQGRTPIQTFTDDLSLYQKYVYEEVDEISEFLLDINTRKWYTIPYKLGLIYNNIGVILLLVV